MALVKRVAIVSVQGSTAMNAGGVLNVTWNLKCYPDDTDLVANPNTPTVIDEDFTVSHKTAVEGLTAAQKVARTKQLFKEEMQPVIDNYVKEQALMENSLHVTAAGELQTELTG